MWRSPCSPCFPSSAASRPSSSMFPCFLEIHKFVVFPIWGNCVSLTNWMRTGFAPLWPVTQLNGKLSDELPERLLSINCSGFLLQNRCTFTFTDTDSNQEIKICGVKMRQEWNNHNQCKLSAVNIVKTVKKIPEEVGVAVLAKLVEDKPVSYLTLAGMLQLKEHTYISKSYRSPASKIELRVGLNK